MAVAPKQESMRIAIWLQLGIRCLLPGRKCPSVKIETVMERSIICVEHVRMRNHGFFISMLVDWRDRSCNIYGPHRMSPPKCVGSLVTATSGFVLMCISYLSRLDRLLWVYGTYIYIYEPNINRTAKLAGCREEHGSEVDFIYIY
jgi:hypothetical protein